MSIVCPHTTLYFYEVYNEIQFVNCRLIFGCPGGGGTTRNQKILNKAPEGSITSPADGETFVEGVQRFQALVSDQDNEFDELKIFISMMIQQRLQTVPKWRHKR